MDPDGKWVKALDDQSKTNIINTLSIEESDFVKFNSDGIIDAQRFNESNSQSANMTALRALVNSNIGYTFKVSIGYMKNGMLHLFTNRQNHWENGVTLIPGAKEDPSPDGNVHIITKQSLSLEDQATNTAHEAYGHAYFYELTRKGYDVNPNHTFNTFVESMYDENYGDTVYISVGVKSNTRLEEQISKVVRETINNIKYRSK